MGNVKIRIQHYVPRFYLKNFSKQKKKEYYINCFDKSTKNQFSTNIDNIGCEKYFYDAEEDVHQVVEKHLGNFEKKFSNAYNKLLDIKNLNELSTEEKLYLSYFIATQFIRTREQRELSRDLIRQIREQIYDESTEELKKDIDEAATDESIRKRHIKMLIESVPIFVDILSKMKWILFHNKTSSTFWTSDNPITLYNPFDFGPYGNLGLACKGIQVIFPLSNEYTLVVSDPFEYGYFPDFLSVTDKNHVVFVNHLQVKWSTRHVLSIDDDFSFAKKMIDENPRLGDINRKRLKVS